MVSLPLKSLKQSPAAELSIDEFVRLFRGDDASFGYAHEGLALQVCERFGPSSQRDLFDRFYPEYKGKKEIELDDHIVAYIRAGYDKWLKLGKPRVGKTGRSER